MKRQFTLETVKVDNSTNIDKNQQLLLKHKKTTIHADGNPDPGFWCIQKYGGLIGPHRVDN